MTTNNAINAPFPFTAAQGGTGVANSNTITIGGNVSTAGAFTISGAFGTTLTVTGTTSVTLPTSGTLATTTQLFAWNTVSGTSQTVAAGNGYFANNAGLVTFTLPTTAAVGDTFRIEGEGAGGWTIVYGTGQSIRIGNQTTTTTSGSLSSTNQYDGVLIVCMTANTIFKAMPTIGNLTVA
jgi:hypothetical protein